MKPHLVIRELLDHHDNTASCIENHKAEIAQLRLEIKQAGDGPFNEMQLGILKKLAANREEAEKLETNLQILEGRLAETVAKIETEYEMGLRPAMEKLGFTPKSQRWTVVDKVREWLAQIDTAAQSTPAKP